MGFFLLLSKLLQFDKKAKRIEIYNDQRFPISGKVLNAWDWNNNNKQSIESTSSFVLKDIYNHINHQKHHQMMDSRKFEDWLFLYLRRAFSFLINLLVIFLTGSLVYYLEEIKQDYVDFFKETQLKYLEVFSYFIPALY